MKDSIKRLVSSEQGVAQCLRDMRHMLEEHGYFNFGIKKGSRSLSQNALYWMWLGQITDYLNIRKGTDFTTDELHLRLKHDFLGYTEKKTIGSAEISEQLKSTTKLTKGEMFHYMQQIDQWAAGIGLLLTRPDDCVYQTLYEKHERGEI